MERNEIRDWPFNVRSTAPDYATEDGRSIRARGSLNFSGATESVFRTNPQVFLCGNKLWKSTPTLLPIAVALFIVLPMRYLVFDSRGDCPEPDPYSIRPAEPLFAACGECNQ
jgi:hypothetical protein